TESVLLSKKFESAISNGTKFGPLGSQDPAAKKISQVVKQESISTLSPHEVRDSFLNNFEQVSDIFHLREGFNLYPITEMKPDEIETAHIKKELVHLKEVDGKVEVVAQNPDLIDPSKPIIIQRPEGKTVVNNFTVREMTEDEKRSFSSVLTIYLIYLRIFPQVEGDNSPHKKKSISRLSLKAI
ncbi:hypothetical protein K2X05_07915, partial [bacterium]|nr:hypothetical protein [bacterium]